jgi:co-chaperonin GroES (HSP10)
MATSTIETLNSPKPGNTFDLGTLKFWARGDRVLIQEDEFKSGYECTVCGGSGKAPCEACGGSGSSATVAEARCATCEGSGSYTCSQCNGKGGLLIAPDVSQRRPTTGTIVSVGPGIWQHGVFVPNELQVGERVLYSNFAGYVIDLDRAGKKVTLRILHEPEVLCGMSGHLELRSLKGKSDIAEFGG